MMLNRPHCGMLFLTLMESIQLEFASIYETSLFSFMAKEIYILPPFYEKQRRIGNLRLTDMCIILTM